MSEPMANQLIPLALAHHRSGRMVEAAKLYQQILATDPGEPTALHMLGVIAGQRGQWDTAVQLIQQSLHRAPHNALAHSNLGKLFFDRNRFSESLAACREAVRLDPSLAEAHYNLGNALYSRHELDEAISHFQQAITLRPDYAKAHHNLANSYKDRAEMEAAVASARRVVELRPDIPESHSNLIFTMLFHPEIDPAAIRTECESFNRRQIPAATTATNSPSHRPLRVGYVSPNFREHCQSLFTIPLLSQHDHQNFHITLYSDVRQPDAITAQLRRHADQWHDTARLNDAALAALIQNDQIDILVDLTMHMAHNRLQVFARKPAAIQLCWLAYPGTTGLSAMDYRLTDPHLDPPSNLSSYSETSIYLPRTFWCYDPLTDLPTSPLPASATGTLTFGCLNNFCKITTPTLHLWADILHNVPNSRLLLLAPTPPAGLARQHVLETFAAQKIPAARIQFANFSPRQQYLQLYHHIDIALDTFPVNGHTTSLDALFMGVPVITLVHPTNPLGRAGLSQLTNLNLPELIAATPTQYTQVAATLAHDLSRLTNLRHTLRNRLQRSPLMNAPQFARDFEAILTTLRHQHQNTPHNGSRPAQLANHMGGRRVPPL